MPNLHDVKTKETASARQPVRRTATRRRRRAGDVAFDVANVLLLSLLAFVTLYPFWNLLIVSLNDPIDAVRGDVYFWPRMFTWKNYGFILKSDNLLGAASMSVLRTLVGTATSVFCTLMLAYTISRKEYVFRKFISAVFLFTMYFSGGLIPGYLLIRSLHLIGSFWVYIVPGLLGAFNLIIARSFIEQLPDSFVEAARMDNASEFRIFLSIILPLSMPVVATLLLFVSVGHWNDWFTTFLYMGKNKKLTVLQYELMKLLQMANTSAGASGNAGSQAMQLQGKGDVITPNALRASMTVLVTFPILLVYPFLQRYFVKGFTIGGVKE